MKKRPIIYMLPTIAFLFLIPIIIGGFSFNLKLIILSLIYAVLVSNWDLTLGYTGIFNFAHGAFFAIGAYTSGILAGGGMPPYVKPVFHVSPWLALLAGGVVASVSSLIIALPSLRLRGIYFALFAFGFQQTLYSVILVNPNYLTGGSQGLTHIPNLQLGPISFGGIESTPDYYLILCIFLASTFFLYKIIHSKIGMAFVALRDSEVYAMSRGIDPYKYKTLSVLISAFFTGIVGAFYAHYLGVISIEILGWGFISLGLSILILGGVGTFFGPIIASFIMTFISEHVRGFFAYRPVIIATILVVVMVLRPSGILTAIPVLVNFFKEKIWGFSHGAATTN